MTDTTKPSGLDAAFVVGLTLIGSRMLARAIGLPPVVGTVVTAGAVVATTTGAGGDQAQRLAAAVLAPANRARLALEGIELSGRLLGDPTTATTEDPS